MPWHARLDLDYLQQGARTIARHRHIGPLRILQSLYPEGDGVCHNVLVHPPGGLVGGDTLTLHATAAPGTHGLLTTPGATRFYRTEGERALQHTVLAPAAGARLEWLPMEAICYDGCDAENRLLLQPAPGGEIIGWDIAALGLPAAALPFTRGRLLQHIELPGAWLERGCIDAADPLLMDGRLGLAGHRCLASIFFAAGTPLARTRRDAALDVARACADAHALVETAGATSPNDHVVVLRVLAPVVEPVMDLLRRVWAAWRGELWGLPATPPRIWAM